MTDDTPIQGQGVGGGVGVSVFYYGPGKDVEAWFVERFGKDKKVGLADLIDAYLGVKNLDPIISSVEHEQKMAKACLNWVFTVSF